LQVCKRARAAGKRIIIDEAWLYKMRPGGSTAIADDTAIFMRDAFDFFAPLDQQFLRYIDDLARVERIEFVSPVWSTYFLRMCRTAMRRRRCRIHRWWLRPNRRQCRI